VMYTLEEVGREFGVTRERIRQIEAKAHEKIRSTRRSSDSWGIKQKERPRWRAMVVSCFKGR